jgi:zinc-ribbon domain
VSYVAAMLIVAGVALYVAVPLFSSRGGARERRHDLELERMMHERGLAVQAIRELEFDREMNKLSNTDYQMLRAQLETRAIAAMTAIEHLQAQAREQAAARPAPRPLRPVRTVQRSEPKVRYCPQCGAKVRQDGNFCTECGTSLGPARTIALSRAE